MCKYPTVDTLKHDLVRVTRRMEELRELISVTAEPPIHLQQRYTKALEKREELLFQLDFYRHGKADF